MRPAPTRATASRPALLAAAAGRGALAGLVGVAAMTAGELLEQALTHRPDSFVPGRTLRTLLGRPTGDGEQPVLWNHAMHWGTGAAVGSIAGVWAALGLRGLRAQAAHTAVRLAFDQTVENATGAGAPPYTWPRSEQVVDVLHKAVYSLVTGRVAERVLPGAASAGDLRRTGPSARGSSALVAGQASRTPQRFGHRPPSRRSSRGSSQRVIRVRSRVPRSKPEPAWTAIATPTCRPSDSVTTASCRTR
ncbi:hypothetical protein SAMN04488543_1765 [Friedmanniella luteola]|uniref:Uncharacterized protein n=1 Tax=Friedmanniella luteola TaxID=546871 RepID=A0A1H1SDF2_9ACTN|nr:hypothetical protein SAMN04488543_1765 [Friedmanniella luteola]